MAGIERTMRTDDVPEENTKRVEAALLSVYETCKALESIGDNTVTTSTDLRLFVIHTPSKAAAILNELEVNKSRLEAREKRD